MRSVLLALPLVVVACASPDDAQRDDADLDTSGCSGLNASATHGPVSVVAERPPTASCWNVDASGLSASYAWLQSNDATPRRPELGFWIELNGAGLFAKADGASCERLASGGLGHDTSGQVTYRCTATKRLTFRGAPALRAAAYGEDGRRLAWDVRVGVALDEAGHWDSLDGQNYRFSL